MKYCLLQVSDKLLNPDDPTNPADVYFKAIWNHLDGEGYFKPEHYWEIPTWIAELSYCLNTPDNEIQLWHITENFPTVLPKADIYFTSVMDCNKEILRTIARSNPEKFFYFGGYTGREEFYSFFCYPGLPTPLGNVSWCGTIQEACDTFQVGYQYGTDYSLFKGIKCIPRLTLSNGCTNKCRFCTVPDEIIETDWRSGIQQVISMRDLDFELIYINDKTFGQCHTYSRLKNIYKSIKEFNPKFRGFTIQTTCQQIKHLTKYGISLKDLHIVNVELGIESYNDDILKRYNKPQCTLLVDQAINYLSLMDINIIPNIIIGLPGETWGTYCRTLEWVNDNKHKFLMLNIFNFVPYVGSDASGIVKTQPEDLNETICKRSYYTAKGKYAVESFTEYLFETGMEILEATKRRSNEK